MNLVRSTAMTALLACGLALITCRTLYGQGSSEPKSSGSAKYVGSEVCQGCHEDQYQQLAASLHVLTFKNKQAELQGCDACHGPGAAHVDAGVDPEKILRFSGASAETIQQRCSPCHAANLGEAHTKARLTCFTCHSVHHYQQTKSILIASEGQLCQKCHRQGTSQASAHRR